MSSKWSLRRRFRQLTFWNKLNVVGALASVVALAVALWLWPQPLPVGDPFNRGVKSADMITVVHNLNCSYKSNYRFLYFEDRLEPPTLREIVSLEVLNQRVQQKANRLSLSVGFENTSGSGVTDVNVEVYARPIMRETEIYPYSQGANEVMLFGTSTAYLAAGESIVARDIQRRLDSEFLKSLFFDDHFALYDAKVTRSIRSDSTMPAGGPLREFFESTLDLSQKDQKVFYRFRVDPFRGYFGLGLRLFVKYEDTNNLSHYEMYYGGLYYSVSTPTTASAGVNVPYPYAIADYVKVAPVGFIRDPSANIIRAVRVIDDTRYTPDASAPRQDLVVIDLQVVDRYGRAQQMLSADLWTPKWYLAEGPVLLKPEVAPRD